MSFARLMGANKRYIEQHIPHISRLMVESLDEVLAHAEVIVVGNESAEFAAAVARRSLFTRRSAT